MGSLIEGQSIEIEGSQQKISNETQHIYVLNSRYFGLKLPKSVLDITYKRCRSALMHHCAIKKDVILDSATRGLSRESDPMAFPPLQLRDDGILQVSLGNLVDHTKKALDLFVPELDALSQASQSIKDLTKIGKTS
jgi:hypothetical protein